MVQQSLSSVLKHEAKQVGPIIAIAFGVLAVGGFAIAYLNSAVGVPPNLQGYLGFALVALVNGWILWKVSNTPKATEA